ncbi:hypothetical protein TRVL_09117 [Trypanosoma vivax]|nr:hypothetical protein TRVL_09117 [Trypanosoma vivax]
MVQKHSDKQQIDGGQLGAQGVSGICGEAGRTEQEFEHQNPKRALKGNTGRSGQKFAPASNMNSKDPNVLEQLVSTEVPICRSGRLKGMRGRRKEAVARESRKVCGRVAARVFG